MCSNNTHILFLCLSVALNLRILLWQYLIACLHELYCREHVKQDIEHETAEESSFLHDAERQQLVQKQDYATSDDEEV